MALRAKAPEVKEKRLKLFVYGPAGVGKTVAALQFPNSYLIDTEKGSDFYAEMINASKSVQFQSVNPDEIRDEIKELLTTKHEYKTLIIDPMTQVYNAIQEKWTRIFEKNTPGKSGEIQDFGMRYWGKVKAEMKSLQRMILALDMNIITTAHQKDLYGPGMQKMGVTFDSMRGDDYLFDLIFQLERRGDKRIAKTVKERALPGMSKFPDEFEWSYENFCKFYGREVIEREVKPVDMATNEQVSKLDSLLKVVAIPEETKEKWLTKTDCDTFDQMTSDQIQKCIDYVEKQLEVIRK